MDIFKKALEWYQKGGDYRAAAEELFPEEKLKREIDNYNKEVREQKMKEREKELKEVLKRCKKLFPIGTLIRSDDGTDHCPNVIISEPYIAETEYHFPCNKHSWDYDKKEAVLVDTIRISMNKPMGKSKVGLETVLYYDNMDKDCPYRRDAIIDLKKFEEEQIKKKNEKLEWLRDKEKRAMKELGEIQFDIAELEEYNPSELTKEKVKEILIQCQKD